MNWLADLIGIETNYLTAVLALGVVIVLIVLVAWLLKLLGQASRTVGRGRNRRLAVIDSVTIDQKRQAVLLRRDGVEHLIVTGGPNDLVVESGFDAPTHGLPRAARRTSEHQETAEPAAEVQPPQRDPGGNGTHRTLRHPGLLRADERTEPQLDGGNRSEAARQRRDSARNGSRPAPEGAGKLEIATEPGAEFPFPDEEKTGN